MGAGCKPKGGSLERFDVGGVDFDADALADEVDREDEARVRALADEAADDALQRAVRHLDHHAFADHRARVVLQIAVDQRRMLSISCSGIGAGLPSNDTMFTTPVHFRMASASSGLNRAKQ